MIYTKRGTILDKDIVKHLYIRQGMSKQNICETLGCTLHILNKTIKLYKIESLLDRYVRYLFFCGKRQYEIGKIIKKDQASVSRRLSRMGVDGKKTKYERTQETIISRYGVDNIQKHPFFREKTTNTNKKRYGYEHPLEIYNSHVTGFFEKNKNEILNRTKKLSFSTKDFIFPSGRIDKVQGAEPLALAILLEDYHENDILTGECVPIIEYYDRKKNRKHYPDIYIPKENRIIEVKTTYTISITKSLMEKFYAAVESGYVYEIWVFNNRNELEEVITEYRTPNQVVKV